MPKDIPPTPDSNTGEKLQKVLARAGLGSRRGLESVIEAGRIKVNGQVAKLGDRVTEDDKITMDGKPVKLTAQAEQKTQVLLYNKQEGEVSTRSDPDGRPTVFDRLPSLTGERWIQIGRLDINTAGLLMFTTDGELANKLMHPSSGIDREYLVRVFGEVDDDMLQRLREGVMLDDGPAQFTDIQEGRKEGSNRWFYVVLMEGRNREVRRLWESQGVKVSRLKRVRYGPVFMPSRLKLGQWEMLEQKDVNVIYDAAGLTRRQVKPLTQRKKDWVQRQKKKSGGKGAWSNKR